MGFLHQRFDGQRQHSVVLLADDRRAFKPLMQNSPESLAFIIKDDKNVSNR